MKKTVKIVILLFLFFTNARNVCAQAQEYEKVLKTDSTSWTTSHLELEFIAEGHAYVNTRDSLLYYDPYGGTNYYCVGRMREENGRLWITYNEHLSEEILVVDMNLDVGDEFLITPHQVARVEEVIYVNGRKVIVFDFVSSSWGGEPLKFVEGVGRNYMVFEWGGDVARNYQSCKYDGDELVYSTTNPLYDGCRLINTSMGEQLYKSKTVEIYPNPAHHEVYISFPNSQIFPCEISILNLYGKVEKTNSVTSGTITIPIGDLCSGIYVIKLVHGNQVLTEKIVINQ